MFQSPSHLAAEQRVPVSVALNAALTDGLDLYSHLKVAHWNIKGPHFASLHPLFETFAVELLVHTDSMAERIVTLGGKAYGTSRHVAAGSRLPDYPQETVRDLAHVALLSERISAWLVGLRAARATAGENGDTDTADLITPVITAFEKHAWFLQATLGE